MLGKLVLIGGILITLFGGLVFIVSLLLPSMTNNRVNFEEALIGIIAGVVVVFFGVILDGVGLFLVFKKKKTPQAP
jgi:hypothetical protein